VTRQAVLPGGRGVRLETPRAGRSRGAVTAAAALAGHDFDQGDALESRPIVFRLVSICAAVKHPFIVDAANVHGLDHAIGKRETDAVADIRSESRGDFVRRHV
jgi:hypothetical protein